MTGRYRRPRRIALRDLNRPGCKTHRCPDRTPLRSRVTSCMIGATAGPKRVLLTDPGVAFLSSRVSPFRPSLLT